MATYKEMEAEQSIAIKNTEWLRDDQGAIIGLPMFDGLLTFCCITDADEDKAMLNALCYTDSEHSALASNYIMAFVSDHSSQLVYDASDLVRICDLEEQDVDVLNDWLIGLGAPSSGLPITATKIAVHTNDGDANAIVFSNMYDFIKYSDSLHLEEEVAKYKKENPNATDDEIEQFKSKVPSQSRRMEASYPDMPENCRKHIYIRSALAKLAGLIQKRYNQIHFEDKALVLADQISAIRYFNDNGEIVPLSITAFDNLINRIKDNIRIH